RGLGDVYKRQDQDGLQWVSATPKSRDGQLQRVRVGFKNDQLAALDILDSLGQRSVLSFRNLQSNPALPASTFDFKPPAGADVILSLIHI
ncbi:outer-membrane lipoprotein carrier protein LolA, partial [Xylophilus sp. ASV27]|uniref:outer-membrane lipoprotein carrier protein LolA n=1 Tax=Xylophilus sp. ASV27 TaxID=2795129 RepID=UPI0018EA822D